MFLFTFEGSSNGKAVKKSYRKIGTNRERFLIDFWSIWGYFWKKNRKFRSNQASQWRWNKDGGWDGPEIVEVNILDGFTLRGTSVSRSWGRCMGRGKPLPQRVVFSPMLWQRVLVVGSWLRGSFGSWLEATAKPAVALLEGWWDYGAHIITSSSLAPANIAPR